VDHFKRGNDTLVALIVRDEGLSPPMALGELACGTPPAPPAAPLGDIGLVKSARQARRDEVMTSPTTKPVGLTGFVVAAKAA